MRWLVGLLIIANFFFFFFRSTSWSDCGARHQENSTKYLSIFFQWLNALKDFYFNQVGFAMFTFWLCWNPLVFFFFIVPSVCRFSSRMRQWTLSSARDGEDIWGPALCGPDQLLQQLQRLLLLGSDPQHRAAGPAFRRSAHRARSRLHVLPGEHTGENNQRWWVAWWPDMKQSYC